MARNGDELLGRVARYYEQKLKAHGLNARGVDWNSRESQEMRFGMLTRICREDDRFSIIDYGCGYGALADFLSEQGKSFTYQGFDICKEMILAARIAHQQVLGHANFVDDPGMLEPADYLVASGIFNVKLDCSDEEWGKHIISTLHKMAALCWKGFSFNALTIYSDADKMRPDLYYADPLLLFDFCKKTFSKYVALYHDYPLYEFTIQIRL